MNRREEYKEKDPKDIFMRPRLVQERQLLEKIRAHADELVNPKEPSVSEPLKSPSVSKTELEKELIPVVEEPEILKSEPPSPTQLRSEPDSFLAEVVEGAKGLNIDLSVASITTPLSPLSVKKPEVTVARSHTVAATVAKPLKSETVGAQRKGSTLIDSARISTVSVTSSARDLKIKSPQVPL